MNEKDQELPKGVSGELLAITASIQIASISKSSVLDLYFFELFQFEKENPSAMGNLAEMLGSDIYDKYKNFVMDEKKATAVGKALQAQVAYISSSGDTELLTTFMDFCQSPIVKEVIETTPDYFKQAKRTHQKVLEEKQRRRLGWHHPDNSIGIIFWRLNMELTQRILRELDGFDRFIPKALR